MSWQLRRPLTYRVCRENPQPTTVSPPAKTPGLGDGGLEQGIGGNKIDVVIQVEGLLVVLESGDGWLCMPAQSALGLLNNL